MASLNYNIADEYEQSKSYSSNDIVIKDKELYFAKSNISANTPFSEDDWQKVFLADLLRGHLNSNLAKTAPLLKSTFYWSAIWGSTLNFDTSKCNSIKIIVTNWERNGGKVMTYPRFNGQDITGNTTITVDTTNLDTVSLTSGLIGDVWNASKFDFEISVS